MDIFEIIKYIIGSLPGAAFVIWKFFLDKRSNDLKDWQDIMVELQKAYADQIELKKEVIKLTVDNEIKGELIKKLENEIERLLQIKKALDKKLQGISEKN